MIATSGIALLLVITMLVVLQLGLLTVGRHALTYIVQTPGRWMVSFQAWNHLRRVRNAELEKLELERRILEEKLNNEAVVELFKRKE
jgi:hypothetical protein